MTIYHLESFIEKGLYSEMKHLESVICSIKENIRAYQENIGEQRIDWKEIGVVSKFVSNKEYNWDMHALKELFFDLGILIRTCTINHEILNEEQLATLKNQAPKRGERYVRFRPNKQLSKVETEVNYADMAPQQQLAIWKEFRKRYEKLLIDWDSIRKIAKFSSYLTKNKRVTFESGTISLLESKPKYNAEDIFNIFGGEALLSTAVIDFSKIEEHAARGFLSKSLINKYRKIVNVNLKFFLIEIEKEKAMLEFNSKRLRFLSNLSINNTITN